MTPILGIIASQITGHLSTNSFESIQTVTVGSGGQSSISFSSIPSTYKHLQIRCFWRDAGGAEMKGEFNSDTTTTNYYRHYLQGDGSGVGAGANNLNSFGGFYAGAASQFGITIMDILDYTNTNKNKTVRTLWGYDSNGSGYMGFSSGLWSNTSAISNITLKTTGTNFVQYSSFALYGIKA